MELHEILTEDKFDDAVKLARAYYEETFAGGLPRTGSRFDDWAGGGAPDVVNRIVADDLLAVSFLAVRVKPRAIIGLLETYVPDITQLLAKIPADLDLADADLTKDLGTESPAQELWDILRGKNTGKWGIGPTTASKILARKRPRLIPVYDSVVDAVVGLDGSLGQWNIWHAALSGESLLPQHLEAIRRAAGLSPVLSPLRVMDVVLWMHGKQQGLKAQDDEEDDSPDT